MEIIFTCMKFNQVTNMNFPPKKGKKLEKEESRNLNIFP